MVNKSKEKETDREINDKKRRKSSTANADTLITKQPKEDIYTVRIKCLLLQYSFHCLS